MGDKHVSIGEYGRRKSRCPVSQPCRELVTSTMSVSLGFEEKRAAPLSQGLEALRSDTPTGFRGLISRELPVTPVSGIRACAENEL